MNEGWDFTSIESFAAKITALTVLCGAAYTTYKAVKKRFERILKIFETIDNIQSELSVDIKGNLRDTIIHIEKRQIRLEERERAFLHTHPHVLFELDEHLNLIWCNKSFLDSFDVDTDSVFYKSWFNLIVEEERSKIEKLLEDSKNGNRNLTTHCTFYKIVNDVNVNLKVSLLATAIFDKEQKCNGFLVNIKFN